MTDLYTKLRDKIDSLLDGEIKKLQFGCKVEIKGAVGKIANKTIAGNYLILFSEGVTTTVKHKDIKEIIGRPIILEDVIIAIELYDFDRNYKLVIHDYSVLDIVIVDRDLEWVVAEWEIGKSLEEQPDSVKKSIAEILGIDK